MVTKYDLSETKARPLRQYRLHEKTPLFEPPPIMSFGVTLAQDWVIHIWQGPILYIACAFWEAKLSNNCKPLRRLLLKLMSLKKRSLGKFQYNHRSFWKISGIASNNKLPESWLLNSKILRFYVNLILFYELQYI